eukprot:TRINITY_DN51_c3_g2_i2.p1 TRINITY_DN51_c3_g2~~TRINITY_DN51_c3_g2_i2.p1  ORF type:complete len:196 (+),score=21.60 TRINITY_DN51_c3_g2_i2:201-788(+)
MRSNRGRTSRATCPAVVGGSNCWRVDRKPVFHCGQVTLIVRLQTRRFVEMDALNQLYRRRGDLKAEGRFEEAIPVQREIVEALQQSGHICDLSNAWNMLSHLYQLNHQLIEAEAAARKAISTYAIETKPRLERLASYEMKLAIILADQRYFAEAVRYGQSAVAHFSHLHNPPDDFLRARQNDVERMICSRDQATE